VGKEKINKELSTIKKQEDWMNTKWRPMMGWLYLLVCVFDFVFFPVLWSLIQALGHGQVNMQWQPMTLQGAGLFHISMGAILGIAVYGRTQEKLNGVNNSGFQTPLGMMPMNVEYNNGKNFQSVPVDNFGTTLGGFPTETASRQNIARFGHVTTGFGGRPAPVEPFREWI
jgi:hypothetical protein